MTLFALCVVAAACGKSAPAGDSPTAASEKPPAAAARPNPEDVRLEAAIDCMNALSKPVFAVREAYLGDVEADGTPKPNRPMVIVGVPASDQCQKQVAAAVATTPAIPDLDAAMTGYVAKLAAFNAARDELAAYYAKKDNLADGGARGKELHPKFLAAVDAFQRAHRALDGQIRTRNRKHQEAALDAKEKQAGRNLDVLLGRMMMLAEDVITAIKSDPPGEPPTEALSKLSDEIDAYASAHADEAKGWGSLLNMRNYLKQFVGAARSPKHEDLVATYNHLVENYNHH